jgi:exodeoxyribonuclease-3
MLNKGELFKFMVDADPDILCLNETKIDADKLKKDGISGKLPEGYLHYFNCCKVKKGYSGTAILSKVPPINVTYDMGVSKHDGEGRVTAAEFKEFIVIAVYVPNAGEGLKRLKYRVDEWDVDFFDYIRRLEMEK